MQKNLSPRSIQQQKDSVVGTTVEVDNFVQKEEKRAKCQGIRNAGDLSDHLKVLVKRSTKDQLRAE